MKQADRLCTAAATGDTALVERLLRDGTDPNGTNKYGRSAIQVMMMGCPAVARLLLQFGAEPNRADGIGMTPLHDAVRCGFADTVGLLLLHGADPQARDRHNRSPVDVARQEGHTHLLDMFQVHQGARRDA